MARCDLKFPSHPLPQLRKPGLPVVATPTAHTPASRHFCPTQHDPAPSPNNKAPESAMTRPAALRTWPLAHSYLTCDLMAQSQAHIVHVARGDHSYRLTSALTHAVTRANSAANVDTPR